MSTSIKTRDFIGMIFISCCTVLLSNGFCKVEDNFYAYYTKLDIEDEPGVQTGKFADIAVHFSNDKQVLFSTESSYLPCWETNKGKWHFDEIIERTGDGSELRPDISNRYSHVRLIKNSLEEIVVHWRYVPDFNKIGWYGFVDEYFRFYPDGRVARTVREGSEKLVDWQDPANVTMQILHLNEGGIKTVSTQRPILTKADSPAVQGNRIENEVVATPLLWFKFDEGGNIRKYEEKDITIEAVQGIDMHIAGNKSIWKKGVSGTCLAFDGYSSGVTLPSDQVPKVGEVSDGFTVEAWVAIGAYSWRWSPIVHQSEWGQSGYFLGINDAGHVGFMAKVGDTWEQAVSRDKLERFEWRHIAGTFDIDDGLLCIYLDGELISCNRTKREIAPDVDEERIQTTKDRDLLIGLNNEQMRATNAHRQWTYPSIFGFDGLIDEVRIYAEPLSWEQIKKSYELYKPSETFRRKPDMDARHLPANPHGRVADKFGAQYAKLDYYETWDNMWRVGEHPDVLVTFEASPARFAFWRGLSYGIGFITENGKWCGDQSREDWGESYARGCCEHMSDKQCRHSHVRIIENTDARAVVHWRYGEVDVRYRFVDRNGPFADEYWTFYPDGIGIRHVASGEGGWQETMFYSEPGTKPEDNVYIKAFTAIDEEGNEEVFDWSYHYPYKGEPKSAFVTMVNMKSEYKPFYIYPSGSTVETFVPPLIRRDYSAFHWANHYPVTQIASDGRSAEANDRAAHSSLVWGDPAEDYLMVGLANKKAQELMVLARSWNNPAELSQAKGCNYNGYKPEQRAYLLERKDENISFKLEGSEENPIINPAFVIKNWTGRKQKAGLEVNGEELKSGNDFQQGLVFDTNGRLQLVIWVDFESTSPAFIEIKQEP